MKKKTKKKTKKNSIYLPSENLLKNESAEVYKDYPINPSAELYANHQKTILSSR